MSIKIIKKGLLDTMQDLGRFGSRDIGISTNGAMDTIAASIANIILGNNANEAIIEVHFPAATILFNAATIIALAGADFLPNLNNVPITMYQPIKVKEGDILTFMKSAVGARCYVAIYGGWAVDRWLQSYSTHLIARVGGYRGRALLANDIIEYKNENAPSSSLPDFMPLYSELKKWTGELYSKAKILIVKGKEYDQLDATSKTNLLEKRFQLSAQSNRMGYRLQGPPLMMQLQREMISTAVMKGTIQVVPSGQLILLMADCQTTGGYPVVAHVAMASMHNLAQLNAGNTLGFEIITLDEATTCYIEIQMDIQNWITKCKQYMTNTTNL